MKTNLKMVKEAAQEFKNVEEVKKAIRSVQSRKSRLKKQKGRSDYNEKMSEILDREQLLKEVREYFEPKEKPVTQFTKSDIEKLTLAETNRAINSIQSKKCLVQFNAPTLEENVEYQQALEIEKMLQEHKKQVKPIEDTKVTRNDLRNMVDTLENQQDDLTKEDLLELLKKMI